MNLFPGIYQSMCCLKQRSKSGKIKTCTAENRASRRREVDCLLCGGEGEGIPSRTAVPPALDQPVLITAGPKPQETYLPKGINRTTS